MQGKRMEKTCSNLFTVYKMQQGCFGKVMELFWNKVSVCDHDFECNS